MFILKIAQAKLKGLDIFKNIEFYGEEGANLESNLWSIGKEPHIAFIDNNKTSTISINGVGTNNNGKSLYIRFTNAEIITTNSSIIFLEKDQSKPSKVEFIRTFNQAMSSDYFSIIEPNPSIDKNGKVSEIINPHLPKINGDDNRIINGIDIIDKCLIINNYLHSVKKFSCASFYIVKNQFRIKYIGDHNISNENNIMSDLSLENLLNISNNIPKLKLQVGVYSFFEEIARESALRNNLDSALKEFNVYMNEFPNTLKEIK